MKTVVTRVSRTIPLAIEEIDISGDEELEERYGLEIPVLLVEGKKAAKYRITDVELMRIVSGRSGEYG
jgi:hypothetical protein